MKNKFYPVIHVKNVDHALLNAKVALDNGADGVFLINMGDTTRPNFFNAYESVKRKCNNKDFRVGINFLLHLNEVPTVLLDRGDYLWSDTLLGYDEDIKQFIFFAPYQFKYQRDQTSLENVEKVADVICTSGEGTGKPPSLAKVQTINHQTKKPLAVASGIAADNVRQFKPYVRDFLVGTSIGYHNLIPEKVKELADIIHEK